MKLDSEQVDIIDKTLENKSVVYIDFKFEIVDHIATEVEELMGNEAVSFDEALVIVLEKWSPKFKKSTSTSFGLMWSLPEILMRKAKKIYWKKMLKLLLATAIFTPILVFFKEYFTGKTMIVFYFICAVLGIQFIGYLMIRISKQKTTFGFLYKQQFFAFLAMHFIVLHSLTSNKPIFERPENTIFPIFFLIAFLVLALIANFNLLKEHFNQLSRNKKFI